MTTTQSLISKTAIVAYGQISVYVVVSSIMVFPAIWLYWFFYQSYIPNISYDRPVHLQFPIAGLISPSQPSERVLGPRAVLNISDADLFPDQNYNMIVHLDMPTSTQNKQVGNFMIDLRVYGLAQPTDPSPSSPNQGHTRGSSTGIAQDATSAYTHYDSPPSSAQQLLQTPKQLIYRSARPAILKYNSLMVDLVQKTLLLPLYATGWFREAEQVRIPILEDVRLVHHRRFPAIVTIDILADRTVQVNSARLEIVAQLEGLRYAMHTWFFTVGLLCVLALWAIEISFFSTGLAVLLLLMSTGSSMPKPPDQQNNKETVKQEQDAHVPNHQKSQSRLVNSNAGDQHPPTEGLSRSASPEPSTVRVKIENEPRAKHPKQVPEPKDLDRGKDRKVLPSAEPAEPSEQSHQKPAQAVNVVAQ